MDAVDCAQLRVLPASPGGESVAFEASGVLGVCVCVWWGGENEGDEGDELLSWCF